MQHGGGHYLMRIMMNDLLANAIKLINELEAQKAELLAAITKIANMSPYSDDIMDAISVAGSALSKMDDDK
jgi:hypothetical protein